MKPLVSPEVNLRGLQWMRLDTGRLLDSDLFALSTGDEFKAAVALWCKSWTQEPAGSLPTDDRVLAHLSGAGARWKRVKTMALRGWRLADDGRLYHEVVAEQVLAAWEERQEFRAEVEATNERKRRERAERAAMFRELKANGHELAWNTPTGKLRDLLRDSRPPVTQTGHTGHGDSHGLDGTGRDGTGSKELLLPNNPSAGSSPQGAAAHALALRGIGFSDCSPMHPELMAARAEGITPEELVDAAKGRTGKPLAWIVQRARGRRTDALERSAAAKGSTPASTPVAPAERAKADAAHRLADQLHKIRNDCDVLGLIDEAERDRRIAAARADAEPEQAREAAL